MIKNDWQLRVTQKRIKDFEDALFELKQLPDSKSQPWLRAAQRESLEAERDSLCRQVDEYELLKAGKVVLPGPEVIQQVPDVLIKTRISKGLNQEDLAAKLGVSKQCVQQYEQTNYAHVTLSTVRRVMDVLLEYDVPTKAKRPAGVSRSARKVPAKTNTANKAVAPKKATGLPSRKRGS